MRSCGWTTSGRGSATSIGVRSSKRRGRGRHLYPDIADRRGPVLSCSSQPSRAAAPVAALDLVDVGLAVADDADSHPPCGLRWSPVYLSAHSRQVTLTACRLQYMVAVLTPGAASAIATSLVARTSQV